MTLDLLIQGFTMEQILQEIARPQNKNLWIYCSLLVSVIFNKTQQVCGRSGWV